MKTFRAANKNSAEKASSSAAAARSRRSRSSASCSRRFDRPRRIASSPARESTSELCPSSRRRVDRMTSRTPGSTLVDVHLSRAVRVELAQRVVEPLRLQQEHERLVAARLEEVLDDLVRLDRSSNLVDGERTRVVLVDELEHLARLVQKLLREGLVLRARLRRGLGAVLGPLLELVREGLRDGRLPAWNVDR